MAAPHVVQLTKVGFNSATRTVSNISLTDIGIDVYDDTSQTPFNSMQNPIAGPAYTPMGFTTEMNPSGSAAGAKTPPDGTLMKACWMKEDINGTTDTTYSLTGLPTDATAATLTKSIGAGYLMTCTDALGSLTIRMAPNQPPLCDWRFTGKYTAPSEATIADALDNGGLAPVCIGTCTVAGDTLVLKNATINIANTINGPRYDMAGTNGVSSPVVGGQICTASMLIELPAVATENYITDLLAGTVLAVSLAIGSGAGYVITITFKGYLTGVPQFSTAGGVLHATLNMRMGWAATEPLEIEFT